MDFSDSDNESNNKQDWQRIHDKKMKKLDLQKKNWGKNRSNYYNSDTQYFEAGEQDEDDMKAEEREIKMIQQEQAALMTKMDFGLESLLGKGGQVGSIPSTSKQSTKTTDSTAKNAKFGGLMARAGGNKGKSIVSIEERVRLVLSASPELLSLLSQYLTSSQELNDILPLLLTNLTQIKQLIEISPIVSLLKLRQQLLLSFCQCMLYYLYLKSMSKSTADHPVMTKLLALQTLIDAQQDAFTTIRTTLLDLQVKFINPYEEYQTEMAKRTSSQILLDDDDEDGYFDANETAADFYNRVSGGSKAQKAAREEIHRARVKRVRVGSNIIEEGTRRGIGIKIDRNVGLRRQKSRKQIKHSTTRGKLRKKHDTAIKKRKNVVREFKGSQGIEYTGESTIKKGIVRSVKL